MKTTTYYIALLLIVSYLYSCKKDDNSPSESAALTIVNMVTDPSKASSVMAFNFENGSTLKYFRSGLTLNYGTSVELGAYTGKLSLGIFNSPDTIKSIYNLIFNLPMNSIQTLFLTGTVTRPDTLFIKDILKVLPDSTIGIRFINLSYNAQPVSVNIKTKPNGSEVMSLPYKTTTGFIGYPAISTIFSYIFEFRDAGTGALLATYTMNGVNNGTGTSIAANLLRNRNVTIAIYGLPGGTGNSLQKTMLINNY